MKNNMQGNIISKIIFDGEIGKSSYLNGLPAVRFLMRNGGIALNKQVTFFVGENGTGKSTLLEAVAIAAGFNSEGGTRNFAFSTKDTHSELWKAITLVKERYPKDGFFLRAESLYNVATNMDELDAVPMDQPLIKESYGGRSLHEQSHGESFLAIVQNRFTENGIYILDEPEAALSPMRQLALMNEINSLEKGGSQFIIATHSPMLTAMPGAEVLEFSQQGIESVDWRETEHYKTLKGFFDDPERMLHYLLGEHE